MFRKAETRLTQEQIHQEAAKVETKVSEGFLSSQNFGQIIHETRKVLNGSNLYLLKDLIHSYWESDLRSLYRRLKGISGILLRNGVYMGAASDISTFLLLTNAVKGALIDLAQYHTKIDRAFLENPENLKYYVDLKKDWGDWRGDTDMEDKRIGWIMNGHFERKFGDNYLPALIWELLALGAAHIKITTLEDNRHILTFNWRHPEENIVRKRKITLLGNTDIKDAE